MVQMKMMKWVRNTFGHLQLDVHVDLILLISIFFRIKKPSLNSLKKLTLRGKKSSTAVEEEPAPVAADVDPVMEARDADEGALDTPHDDAKDEAKEEGKEETQVEEARDTEATEDKREDTPAEEEDIESVKTEPSNDEDDVDDAEDAEPTEAAEQPVDQALSTVKEEEEEVEKEEPVVSARSHEEVKEEVAEKAMEAPNSEEDATVESRDTTESNKGCLSPVNTSFCGFNIRACFE